MNAYLSKRIRKAQANPEILRLTRATKHALGAALCCLVLCSAPAPASGTEHSPDGAIGKPGLQLWGFRTDLTFDGTEPRGADGAEFSSGQARILIPVSRKLSFFTSYRAENRLNILHQVKIGARIRIFQPESHITKQSNINPDGPLGKPYFTVSGGFRTYETETDVRFGIGSLEIVYPWSHQLTISAGAEINTDTSQVTVDKFFGSLSIYTSRYLPNEPFANPDGPVGYLNFRLAGGGSAEGFFGQLDVLFPLNDQVTIGGFIRGERVEFPYEKNGSLGVRFQLYPGVVR